jgi:hypothetical protein
MTLPPAGLRPVHIYKSRFLVRGEVWYDQEPDQTPVDWVLYRQRSRPVSGASWDYFYTIVLDLRQSSQGLLGTISKSAVYKIRRAAERDGIVCECHSRANLGDLDWFERAYARFAEMKGLDSLDRPLLSQLAKEGFLEISVAKDAHGKPWVHHLYYRSRHRSCLMHCVSLYQEVAESSARNAIGRANRYLFWNDVLRHKEQGLETFDFGGWYPGRTNQALLNINRFKEEFGGKIKREYNCREIRSLKGWIVLRTAKIMGYANQMSTRLKADKGPFSAQTLPGMGGPPPKVPFSAGSVVEGTLETVK